MSLLLLFRHGATHAVNTPYFPDGLTTTTTAISGQTQTDFVTGGATTSTAAGGATSTVEIDSGLRGADIL